MVEKCYLEAGNSSTGEVLVLQSMSTWVSSAHQPKKKKKANCSGKCLESQQWGGSLELTKETVSKTEQVHEEWMTPGIDLWPPQAYQQEHEHIHTQYKLKLSIYVPP